MLDYFSYFGSDLLWFISNSLAGEAVSIWSILSLGKYKDEMTTWFQHTEIGRIFLAPEELISLMVLNRLTLQSEFGIGHLNRFNLFYNEKVHKH